MEELVEVKNLSRKYGDILAVDGLSFSLKKGEVLGFLGPNGAGKSTTMKILCGFLTPSSGTAKICGFDIQEQSREARKLIGYLPENAPLYGEMTVRDFLFFVSEVRQLETSDIPSLVEFAVAKTNLSKVLDQRIETLSKGFKRRVGLAQAIVHNPKVLILDEPTDGLDPNQKHEVRNLINEMASEKAIIVSTHILEEVDAVCSRVIIISNGKLVTDSTPMELRLSGKGQTVLDLRLAAGVEDKVVTLLNPISGFLNVKPIGSGLVQISSNLSRSESILTALKIIKESGIEVKDIGFDSGQLDEVFRDLTA
jgi:ABC-2 type transport system ATP-binding protein